MWEQSTKGLGCGFLPTPSQRDWKGGSGTVKFDKNGKPYRESNTTGTKWGVRLDALVDAWEKQDTSVKGCGYWPTPTKREYKGARKPETLKAAGRTEDNSLCDKVGYTTKGQLNPDWVEWLMGWPIGWSSLDPIEELVWLDWSTDPADVESDEQWRSPNANDWRNQGCSEQIYLCDQVRPSQGIIPRVAVGIKDRVNRLKAIGNGQVSLCTKIAFEILILETDTPLIHRKAAGGGRIWMHQKKYISNGAERKTKYI